MTPLPRINNISLQYVGTKILAAALLSTICFSAPARAEQLKSMGTGFAISSEGWIVTNAHVVKDCSHIEVAGHGVASTPHIDKLNDLAVIKVPPFEPSIPIIEFSDNPAHLGDDITAFGYPLSGILSEGIKVTFGQINAVSGLQNDSRYMQMSAQVQPGNSGGPLVNDRGALVGINTARLSDEISYKLSGSIPQNINFSIKTNMLEGFLESENVPYNKAPANAPLLSKSEIADKISSAVFQIGCYINSNSNQNGNIVQTSQQTPPPSLPPYSSLQKTATERSQNTTQIYSTEAIKQFTAIINLSKTDKGFIDTVAQFYTDPVNYYGKLTPKNQVLREKLAYISRWPVRDYQIKQGSIDVACGDNTCLVGGTVCYYAANPHLNKKASGCAILAYGIKMTDPFAIWYEYGHVLKRLSPK